MRASHLLILLLFVAVPAQTDGPVVLGGDDTTDHGGLIPVPLPGTGVTVPESESNDTFGTADPITLGDDFTGEFSLTLDAPTGATVPESEPNNSGGMADLISVGDTFDAALPISIAAGNGTTVTESESNDTSGTADPVAVGNDIEGMTSADFSALSGNEVVESESNNTSGTADPISLGDLYSGNISIAGDSDYVSFTVPGTTTIYVSIESSVEPEVIIYDTDGTTDMASFDGDGSSTLLFDFELTGGGTYFMEIKDESEALTGNYLMELRTVTSRDEFDYFAFSVGGAGSYVAAIRTVDFLARGRLEALNTDGTSLIEGVTFDCCGDGSVRYLYFDLPGPGTYFLRTEQFVVAPDTPFRYLIELRTGSADLVDFAKFTLGAPADVAVFPSVTDPVLASSSRFEYGGDSVIPADLSPGEWVVMSGLAAGDHFFWLDGDGGANPISPNSGGDFTVQTRNVTATDTSDFVSFNVAGATSILLTFTGPFNSFIELRDTDGTSVLEGGTVEPGEPFLLQYDLPAAGTYYILIGTNPDGAFGPYTLETRVDSGTTTLGTGWLYIRNVLAAIAPKVTRPGNDGSIAALGTIAVQCHR